MSEAVHQSINEQVLRGNNHMSCSWSVQETAWFNSTSDIILIVLPVYRYQKATSRVLTEERIR